MSSEAQRKIKAILAQMPLFQGVEGIEAAEDKIALVCKEYNYALPAAQHLFLQATKCDRNDQLERAIELFQAAIDHCNDDMVQKLHIFCLLGSLYTDREEYYHAYEVYKELLDNIHCLDDNYRSLAYTNISDFHLCLEQYQQALEIGQLGSDCADKVSHRANQAICLLNMGYALSHLQQPKQAIANCQQALELGFEFGYVRVQAIAYGYMAQIRARHFKGGDPKEVIDLFEQAEHLYESLFDSHNRSENQVYYIEFISQYGDQTLALERAEYWFTQLTPEENYGLYAKLCQTLVSLLQQQQSWRRLSDVQHQYIKASQAHLNSIKQKQNLTFLKQIEQATTDNNELVAKQIQQHMGVVTEVGQYIATSANLTDNLAVIYEKVCSIFPTDEFGIALYNEETQWLDYCYFYDYDGPVPNYKVDCAHEESMGSYVVKHKRTVHLNRIDESSINAFVPADKREEKDCVHFIPEKQVQSLILAPICLGDKVLGILSLQHHLTDQYHQYHCNLFEQLASFIAIALENHVQRHHLQQANLKLDTMSKTDPLTGLFNRYQLDHITPQLIERSTQANDNLAVIVLDIDYYKGYNDFHGHHKGDLALQAVAKQMSSVFSQDNNYLFRYGGDEFLILCLGLSQEQLEAKLYQLSDGIRELALSNPLSKCSPCVTLSIGAANFTHISHSQHPFASLFTVADEQLYKAKKSGRNQIFTTRCTLD